LKNYRRRPEYLDEDFGQGVRLQREWIDVLMIVGVLDGRCGDDLVAHDNEFGRICEIEHCPILDRRLDVVGRIPVVAPFLEFVERELDPGSTGRRLQVRR
jgi:hypothetical protein